MRSRRSKLGQQDIFDEQEKWLQANDFRSLFFQSFERTHAHNFGHERPRIFCKFGFPALIYESFMIAVSVGFASES